MADFCPNCDQPLREGAKFCTSCGHLIQKPEPAAKPSTLEEMSQPTKEPSPQQVQTAVASGGQGGHFCPHCGKPNRREARFCRNCGETIPGDQAQLPAPPPVAEVPPRSRARLVTVGFLVFVILMVCVSVIGIGWGLGVDLWLFPTATPTPSGGLNFVASILI
jgi:uncharacterized membrane protein YvbJ